MTVLRESGRGFIWRLPVNADRMAKLCLHYTEIFEYRWTRTRWLDIIPIRNMFTLVYVAKCKPSLRLNVKLIRLVFKSIMQWRYILTTDINALLITLLNTLFIYIRVLVSIVAFLIVAALNFVLLYTVKRNLWTNTALCQIFFILERERRGGESSNEQKARAGRSEYRALWGCAAAAAERKPGQA